MNSLTPARRHFTAAARAAAIEARRRKREEALPLDTPDVFVVRLPGTTLQFGWEIRRFGGVVIDKSCAKYTTTRDAYAAGREALCVPRIGA